MIVDENQVETDLLNVLPKWEEANGRPFMVQGERVVDKIYDAREAKESAKEAKKVGTLLNYSRSSSGYSSSISIPTSSLTPSLARLTSRF